MSRVLWINPLTNGWWARKPEVQTFCFNMVNESGAFRPYHTASVTYHTALVTYHTASVTYHTASGCSAYVLPELAVAHPLTVH